MSGFFRKTFSFPALGSALLWGLLELIARQGSRFALRSRKR